MSGGHFAGVWQIADFAEQLDDELTLNGSSGGFGFKPDTVTTLRKCEQMISLSADLARLIDLLYSGDYGEETFLAEVRPMLEAINSEPRTDE